MYSPDTRKAAGRCKKSIKAAMAIINVLDNILLVEDSDDATADEPLKEKDESKEEEDDDEDDDEEEDEKEKNEEEEAVEETI